MLVITKEDIAQVFSMQDAIEAAKQALRLYTAGNCTVPLRVNIDVPKEQGQNLFMPAYIEDMDATGIKIVSVFPNNIKLGKPSVPAQMIMLDGKTGEVSAIIDGTYLTQLRTGAVQGAATDILARQDAKIGVLIGTGGQAATQLEAMLTVRELTEVRVCDLNLDRAQAFAESMQEKFAATGVKIVPMTSANDAVPDADIITTVTTSPRPVFDGNLVKPGTHVNGIGAYTPQIQELPETIVARADRIVFDTNEGVLAEAGDIMIPLAQGLVTQESFTGELGQVILGQVPGRTDAEQITLFKTVGTAVLDVVTAQLIYEKALASHVGQTIAL